jgi:hypothetical protein
MNTSHQQTLSIYSIIIGLALGTAVVAPVLAQQPDPLDAQEAWQNNRLLTPTSHQRAQEEKGRVIIYDGLKDTTIEKAMDKAFDRIQNMMFIRVIRTGKGGQPMHDNKGELVVEDDDC